MYSMYTLGSGGCLAGIALSSLLSVKYIAPVWGEKRETNHTKSVQEPLSAAWILRMGMEEALGYIFRSDNGQKKQNAKKGSVHAPLGKTKEYIVDCVVSENPPFQMKHCCLQRRRRRLFRKGRACSQGPGIAYLGRLRNSHAPVRHFQNSLKMYHVLKDI